MVETYCGTGGGSASPTRRGSGKSVPLRVSSDYNLPEVVEDFAVEEEKEERGGVGGGGGGEEDDEDTIGWMSSRLSAALGNYVRGKVVQWEGVMKEVMKIFSRSISRLRRLVRTLLSLDGGTDSNVQRVLYIVSFLFKAMKHSHTCGGIGVELMWSLFKDIVGNLQDLNEIRIPLPSDKKKTPMDNNTNREEGEKEVEGEEEHERRREYVSQYLMKLFSFPPNPNSITEMIPNGGAEQMMGGGLTTSSTQPSHHHHYHPQQTSVPSPSPSFLSSDALLIRRFEEAITATLRAEVRYGVSASNRLQENKHDIKIAIGHQLKEELEALELFAALVTFPILLFSQLY